MSVTFTDRELVARTLKNPHDYALIIDRFEVALLRYALRLTGAAHEDVEDIVQMAFIKAYRSLHGFNPALKLSSWLYRIVHNLCVDFLRKNERRSTVSLDMSDDENQSLLDRISSEENVALHVRHADQKMVVHDLISHLPDKYRIVIILYFLEEKSYEEISDILQIPVNTVGTLLNRAKKHFLALTSEPQFSHLTTYAES